MMGYPIEVIEHAILLDEANYLCRRLQRLCTRALNRGDMAEYSRLLQVQVKAIARWRRRNSAAIVRRAQ